MRRMLAAGSIVLAAAIGLYVYGSGGATRVDSARSPDGTEAIDFYAATRLQRWQHPNADLIGFVGLRRLSDDTTLATSDAFELTGERLVIWGKERVQVGSSAVFDRAQRRWSVID
ncbi:hypothetical protein [Sphingomonas sp. PB4P5]|uniref:hypothetical protein n=1 Tax=Parasphingomonas puruogangriensis TaxID=3096155 RepID=UPI002FCAF253